MAAALFWLSAPCPSPPNLVRLSNSRHPYNPTPSHFTSSQDYGCHRRIPVTYSSPTITHTSRSFRCFAALTPELKSSLDKVVKSHKVIVFIKGTKEFPGCGFSNTVVQIIKSLNVAFETINILENELLRQALKEYSSWPTFPQLYIDGEFFGGCDITVEAYKSGELQEVVERAICS
ncbi:Monothiol glutaredoxin-S14- chloroplastic [Striga hermonthica]|uniref:Monothiol glutaredoxin-S14- chloroplastic n=1 Tax=Striga hermonthica TaxID=68872 RepID=A0A9N7ML22_STRHE|nr:Monothiol glutaredoxin-S14- chloroplastic [Striga hermonthica]